MSLSHEDVKTILTILDQADCDEVDIEFGDFKLHLRRHGHASDHPHGPAVDNQGAVQGRGEHAREIMPSGSIPHGSNREELLPEDVVAVTAPMVGTFYRTPAPGEKPFVEQGDRVTPEDPVCLLEVMKLFNSVKAGMAGTVERILVENGTLVAYGQALVLIRKETTTITITATQQ
jgi:acetyl-CoA carboxylase biotin carboxyl carrier protein